MQISNHRLSNSPLWEWQRTYFATQGVQAWAENVVPDFVTNNCFTAAAFARVLLARMQDYVATTPQPERVYLLEAGAGSGRFAFRVLQQLRDHLVLPVPFTYVLTDFTDSILDFWRDNPRLQPFMDGGWLDFAIYDAASDAPIRLENSGTVLTPGSLASPLLVVGNYYFDSLRHDLFRMQAGELQEGRVTFSVPESGGAQGLGQVLQSVAYVPAVTPAYGRTDWEAVVDVYRRDLPEGTFTFPVGGLRSLEYLANISRAGCFMLAADKGPNLLPSLRTGSHESIDKHGAVSVSVNFHAIAQWVTQGQGCVWQMRAPYHRLNVAAFQVGGTEAEFPATTVAFRDHLQAFGPDDFANAKDLALRQMDTLSANELFSIVRLARWDPEILLSFLKRVAQLLPTLQASVREAFLAGFRQSWEQHYPLNDKIKFAFLLGSLCVQVAAYQPALRFFVLSVQHEGESPESVFNAALCLARLGAYDESRAWLARAEALGVSEAETDLVRAELD